MRETPFEHVWVQPAAGDAGTALGAALAVAAQAGEWSPDLSGPIWAADSATRRSSPSSSPPDSPIGGRPIWPPRSQRNSPTTGSWRGSKGALEFGPRALGYRSLLAHPGRPENLARLNDVKGREQFRPIAPMVRLERAPELFGRGPIPSPYMLFVHDVATEWRDRIPAVVHVDGTARIQTVDPAREPLLDRMLGSFEQRTGPPGRRQHEPEHRRPADGRQRA